MSENPTPDETPEPEFPIVTEPKPVVMRKGSERIEVGHAIVTLHEHRTEIQVILDTHGGQEMASFLASRMCSAVSIGGILDEEIAAKIVAQNN